MSQDLSPEQVLKQLDNCNLAPYYLFHGPSEFLKETTLTKFKKKALEPATADLNLQIFYADEATAEEVIEAARSLPFMAETRLVIVRRTESFSKADQDNFLPYLDNPVSSTCLIFVAREANFRHPLFSRIRKEGRSVAFLPLKESRVVPWLMATAKDMGLKISPEACAYLHQIVGNSLMELHGELEKLSIRYGANSIGIDQVREMATNIRGYSVFELIDSLSEKHCQKALEALHKLLEQGGRNSALSILGMLNRQFRLLWKAKHMKARGAQKEIPKVLGIPPFLARKLMNQVDNWSEADLKRLLESLCMVDSRLKSGSQEDILLDHLIMTLCQC